MSLIRRNIIANVAGRGWGLLLSLAVVPLYIHFIGIEAYGLIGFFLSLMAILSLLDLGLGTALNREFARYSIREGDAQAMHDLLLTLERIYWLIGIVIAVTLAALSPAIAAYWIRPQQLPTETVAQALIMLSVSLAFQWPRALYSGGLMGLQRQVPLNLLVSVTGTANSIGGVLVLWLVSPTIQALIAWSMVVSAVDVFLMRMLLRRYLPVAPMRPGFSRKLLAEIWRFAAGMTGITMLSVILSQLDKMILVKVLPLDAFGYYSVAWRVAGGLFALVSPVSAAFLPRFAQLLLTGDQKGLARLYHRGCQLMSAVVLPGAVVLLFFAADFLLLWTQDAAIAANSGTLLALLTAGAAIGGVMNIPFTLQLASGRTRLLFYTLAVAVILSAPCTYLASLYYGGVGAAWVSIIVNCAYIVFYLPLMHHRLLPDHLRSWLIVDVGVPLAVALAVASLWRQIAGTSDSHGWMLLNLGMVTLVTLLATALAAPQIREIILHFFAHRSPSKAGS